MKSILQLCCWLLPLTLITPSNAESKQESYYGFYPSQKGASHKKFVHNFFGFSIDIPSTWIFGVNGAPPTAVIFLYREGLDTSKFSADYETIEIGETSFQGTTLKEAQEQVMRGMRAKHTNITFAKDPTESKLNELTSISWIYTWPSKSGFTVTEYITLIKSTSGTRSITVRTTQNDLKSKLSFFDDIISTFTPFAPKHKLSEQ
jgi:hypothetical protein